MKIVRVVCLIAAPLALAACGSQSEETQDPAPDSAAADAAPAAAVPGPEAPVAEQAQVPEQAAPVVEELAPPAPVVASSGPPDSYLVCSACHAVEPGKNGIGPSLAGISGAKAASVPGFAYSDALKKANITWTDAAMDRWLQAPMKMVPGTRMVFGGIPDAAKRKGLIEYMKTL